jgi:hypothetical protein
VTPSPRFGAATIYSGPPDFSDEAARSVPKAAVPLPQVAGYAAAHAGAFLKSREETFEKGSSAVLNRHTPPLFAARPPEVNRRARRLTPGNRRGWENPLRRTTNPIDRPATGSGAATVHGFATMRTPAPNPRTPGEAAPVSVPGRSLASLVGRTMPLGFQLSETERDVLNALGRVPVLSASEVARIAGVPNGITWMETLMGKLAEHGLDLVALGDGDGGEPTYTLRR